MDRRSRRASKSPAPTTDSRPGAGSLLFPTMRDSVPAVIAFIAAVGVAVSIATAMRHQAGAPLPDNVAGGFATGETRFSQVRITGRVGNAKGWTVEADRVQTDSRGRRVLFTDGIVARLYQGGALRVVCKAPVATYDAEGDRLNADGGVRATLVPPIVDRPDDLPAGAGPMEFETESLEWTAGSRTLACPGPVRLTLERGAMAMDSLAVDLQDRSLDADRFQGRIRIQEGDL